MRDTVWTFKTAQFRITLELSPSYESYDGDGEIQRKLNDGEYVQFDSIVRVFHRDTGAEIGFDSLGASVYDEPSKFWSEHRGLGTYACRKEGEPLCGSYFPQMVREACREARKAIAKLGALKVRENAL